ncbi:hypothetical protein [Rugosimonospora africana]|uniref:Uncharacterized protein n=1 Tax=Rugosimonospora africana TaxID=556532 RepID=A0A8J3R3P9_9ACTN|nr:hypothetical protein [Rugosimonospora africana]GIH20912.1 hypothetical protein Raf01_90840 [Rugosimonospora africana]
MSEPDDLTGRRLPGWDGATCTVCPAQCLGLGRFDVVDRPGPDNRYDPALGWRINIHTGKPTCVHPFRVGLPPGLYASSGQTLLPIPTQPPAPSPAQLELPHDPVDLGAWLVASLRVVPADQMVSALRRAEATAAQRFPAKDIVAAMRRVLSAQLRGQ